MKNNINLFIIVMLLALFLTSGVNHSSGNSGKVNNSKDNNEVIATKELESEVILEVNGNQITENEIVFWLNNNKNEIVSQYFNKDEEISWEKKVGDKFLYEILFDSAIEDIKHNYAIWDLAFEEGLIEVKSFNGLINRLNKENELRASKIEKQEVVYGLSAFSLNQYLKYENDNFILQFKDNDDLNVMEVEEEEIKAYYEDNQELFKDNPSMEIKYIKYDYYSDDLTEKEIQQLEEELNSLSQRLEDGMSFETSIQEFPAFKNHYTHHVYTPEEISSDYRGNGDIWTMVSELEEGEISETVNYNDRLMLVQFVKEIEGDYKKFSEVKSLIKAQLKEQHFEKYLNDYIEQSEVVIIKDNFNDYLNNLLLEGVEYEEYQ